MFRNLLHVIRNFKAAFILNLLGLAVAFTAFMMIMMQVRHDLTFDRCYDGAERIFRLDIEIDGRGQAIVNRPLARLFCQSSPEITAGCIMDAGPASNFWYTGEGGTRKGSRETYATTRCPAFLRSCSLPRNGSRSCFFREKISMVRLRPPSRRRFARSGSATA